MYQIRLQQLQQDIRAGLNSGESTPLDMQAIKAKARQRRQQRQAQ